MAEPAEFHLERSWIALSRWVGLLTLAMAAFFFVGPLLDAEFTWRLAAVAGSLALIGALYCLRVGFQSRHYSIELADEGVSVPAEGRWAPWSRLGGLSERLALQRVDILDLTGARFASLEYQLAGFSEALERTIAGLRLESPSQDVFRRRIATGPGLVGIAAPAALIVFGGWLWFSSGALSGLLIAMILVGALAYDATTEIWSVQLRPEGLEIRRGRGRRIVPWHDIASVELRLRPIGHGNQLLDVFLVQKSGSREHIRPLGSNPFHLKARLAARVEVEKAAIQRGLATNPSS